MITNVEMGKNYALYLLPLYGGNKNNVTVIGKTNIDNVVNNQDDYNIYKTYFEPLGYGLTTYYTAIQQDTEIYICNPITSLEPLTISSEKIFIPATLIDMNNSSEYVEVNNLNFGIYPIIKRFSSTDARDKYTIEIVDRIKAKLRELIDFSALDSEVTVSYDTVYITKEEIENIENTVAKCKSDRDTILREFRKRESEKELQFNKTLADMENAKADYIKKSKELEGLKVKLNQTIKNYEDLINQYT
jgi:hypothetical protein